jgi:iron-sulfur cluster repair protein YtfE (RIC family)
MDSLVRLKVQSTLCRLPEEACAHSRSLYDNLVVLLADLQEHTFLEDEILFLEALELEKRSR